MTALAKAPADRFASALAFAEALTAPARPRQPCVAVLPFLNLTADSENEYFADGITEDVIAHLSKIRALKVISRSSVMAFKQRALSPKEIGAGSGDHRAQGASQGGEPAAHRGAAHRRGDRAAPLGRDV